MNMRFITILTIVSSCTLFISGCGDNDSFKGPLESSTLEGGANNFNTQIADFNSFSLSSEKLAVEALNFEGITSKVTARVADRHNNPVPDNTKINFLTNGGSIDQQCVTTNGQCSVTWTEQSPTPPNFRAKIIAYTTGEESFTDLNDNDKYDAGELFTDISEPFFDINENDSRDPLSEEFVDANNDNIFDDADGLFTGTPCVGDVTVCDRKLTLIWDSKNIILSGSFANNVTLTGALPTAIDSSSIVTVTVLDNNSNPLADGTTVEITSSEGTVDPESVTFSPLASSFVLFYETGSTADTTEILKIVVTSPSGSQTTTRFSVDL